MNCDILESVLEITRQKDVDALDYALVATLANLVECTRISLCKLGTTSERTKIEETVGFELNESIASNKTMCKKPKSELIDIEPDVYDCIHTGKTIFFYDDDAPEMRYSLVIPFFIREAIAGVIKLENNHTLTKDRRLIEGMVQVYANHLFIIDESGHDKLTSLLNRRTFESKVNRILSIQRNMKIERDPLAQDNQRKKICNQTSAWLAIIDIDHFKKVNDNWGHIIGDEILLCIAKLMRESFRKSDVLFRFGGEEFLVLLEPIPEDKATMVLEKFRSTIASYEFPRVGLATVSIGFAAISPEDYPTEVLERADKALYYSKDAGRNRISQYEQLLHRGKIVEKKPVISHVELF